MKSVLISIQPKWCELIASGTKTVEIRKTRPKMETPFKVYIYQTKESGRQFTVHRFNSIMRGETQHSGMGKVIGEFVCDEIKPFESEFVDDDCYEFIASLDYDEYGDATGFIEWTNDSDFSYASTDFYKKCCVKYEELKNYMGQGINEFYGWHISNLIIYEKPKELNEFRSYNVRTYREDGYIHPTHEIERPPQSWCYVEEGVQG